MLLHFTRLDRRIVLLLRAPLPLLRVASRLLGLLRAALLKLDVFNINWSIFSVLALLHNF